MEATKKKVPQLSDKVTAKDRIRQVISPTLCLAALFIPFKHNIGQIFLFLAALLSIFATGRGNRSGPILLILSGALIVTGAISTYTVTGNFSLGPAFRLWKYALAGSIFLNFLSVTLIERKLVFHTALISSTITTILIFIFAPRFIDKSSFLT